MMMTILEQIDRTMLGAAMLPADGTVLAALSGGADSVCMTLALRELGVKVHAVHVEHGIRGEESRADCEFVKELCEEQKIALSVVHIDAPAIARERSMSMEEAARAGRYEAIFKAARGLGLTYIATAHHMTDQAETVLWNLIRGSSLRGLGGIRPVRKMENGLVLIRPMIGCRRDQIEQWLKERGISWRNDRTNDDLMITRNAIRRKILPLMEKLNPAAGSHIARAAAELSQIDDYLEKQTDAAWDAAVRDMRKPGPGSETPQPGLTGIDVPGPCLTGSETPQPALAGSAAPKVPSDDPGSPVLLTADAGDLEMLPDVIRRRLFHRMIASSLGGAKDVTAQHVDSLDDLMHMGCGKQICLPSGLRAERSAGELVLKRELHSGGPAGPVQAQADPVFIDLTGGGSWFIEPLRVKVSARFLRWEGGDVPKKQYTKYLAYDTMIPCLTLRTRREGDYLIINSAGGRKKLKDYMIDEKIPQKKRDEVLLIAQESHVLWVIGWRISEAARVSPGVQAVEVTVDDIHLQEGI